MLFIKRFINQTITKIFPKCLIINFLNLRDALLQMFAIVFIFNEIHAIFAIIYNERLIIISEKLKKIVIKSAPYICLGIGENENRNQTEHNQYNFTKNSISTYYVFSFIQGSGQF